MFSTLLVVAFCIFTGHSSRNALEEENARLLRQKTALLQGLASLASETAVAVEDQESEVGFRVSCVSDGKCPDRYYVCIHGRCSMPTDATDTETEVGTDCYNRCRQAGGGFDECTSDCETEKEVGSILKYKCLARDQCIKDCQEKDETKTWFQCMKECPRSLCANDPESDSVDPEEDSNDPEDDSEAALALSGYASVCYYKGVSGKVITDSWCDKRSWKKKSSCRECKYGYYWHWWHTYCCTAGYYGCTCQRK